MTTLPTISSSTAIPWCKRSDLQIVSLDFEGRPSWGVKDPLTLAYFELGDEEYFVLNDLDGQTSAGELCQAFHERFRPRTLSTVELQGFVGQLVSQGLLASNSPGYGRTLVARDRLSRTRRLWIRLLNVLAIKFRGIDPDRALEWMLGRLAWLFSPAALWASVLLIASALTLVVVQFETLIERLPDAQAILNTSNLIWLAVLLGGVKVLHELGHGLACKRFGGECRELGVMLLVFVPTLYCNVSDIWMLRDKWKRIAVSSAGMWVEAVIAAGCTLLWWFSAPGLFHSLCLNLMFICGVSTFLFNGNPLLKYDGYFVMADWLEIPNFQQRSVAAVRSRLAEWYCLPGHAGNGDGYHRQWLLLTYGVASTIYRLTLTVIILWSLHRWLQPHGLGLAIHGLGAVTLGMMVLTPVAAVVQFLRNPENRADIDWLQFGLRAAATMTGILLLLWIPLPNRVVAHALLEQDAAQPVYVTLSGTLVRSVRIGDRVEAGDELARLAQPDVELERIRMEGEVRQHRVRLEQLERRRIAEPEVAAAIPAVREALRDFEKQLEQLQASAERLVLKAPRAGVVLLPHQQPPPVAAGTLSTWKRTPLDPRNAGCFLHPGTVVCLVGPADSQMAVVVISQDDINLVKVGQAVRLRWNEMAGQVMTGQIVEVAALDLDLLTRDLITRLDIPARATASGAARPVGTWYQARVRLDDTHAPLVRSSAGHARILTEPLSLGSRLLRWLGRTFPLTAH